ncbi:MAG: HAD family hydrolase [Lachnospiraceae bacterium]|nr:HAD family hydrolase [Lachnospiraceae bacterium]
MKKESPGNGPQIRVSFDLDEVLFVSPATHKTEPPLHFPFNKIYKERLRLGTPKLIPALRAEGIEVWVYTSSYRTESYIRNLFRHYGVRFDGIINAQRHMKEVQEGRREIMPNKLPNFYHISLHVDDETVFASYGKQYGFKVYELNAQDDDWADKIIEQVRQIKNSASGSGGPVSR